MLNILLCNYNNTSFGDNVIDASTEYLIRRAMKELQIVNYNIIPYNSLNEDLTMIKYADLVILAGGGLIKYRAERIVQIVENIVTEAERLGIPVMFNSVGVEGYDAQNEYCQRLKKCLNYESVKKITTRDDVKTLRKQYCTEGMKKKCKKVIDPAVWCGKVYGIEKDKNSEIIGVGVIRADIFEEYGLSCTSEDIIELYCDIIRSLEEKKKKWVIFTNGGKADADTGRKVLDRLSMSEEGRLIIPETPEALVRVIAGFKGVISGRLHGNIISYGLNIPSVGLVWNEKLIFWGENIGYPERFVKREHFNGTYITERLMQAINQGYRKVKRKRLEASVYRELYKFLKEYGKEMAQIRNTDVRNRKLVVVGIEEYQKLFDDYRLNLSFDKNVSCFLDDYQMPDYGIYRRKKVKTTGQLSMRKKDAVPPFFVIADINHFAEYRQRFEKLGFQRGIDYCNVYEYERYEERKGNILKPIEWSKSFWAICMGVYSAIYFNTNSMEALEENYRSGVRLFETDIYWEEKRIRFFEQKKYQTEFKVATLASLIKFLKQHGEVNIIFDINEKTIKDYKLIFARIDRVFGKHKDVMPQIAMKVKSKNAVRILRKYYPDMDIIYYMPEEAFKELSEYIQYCVDNRISRIMMHTSNYSREVVKILKKHGISTYVYPVNSYGMIMELVENGVEAVGSAILNINTLKNCKEDKWKEKSNEEVC